MVLADLVGVEIDMDAEGALGVNRAKLGEHFRNHIGADDEVDVAGFQDRKALFAKHVPRLTAPHGVGRVEVDLSAVDTPHICTQQGRDAADLRLRAGPGDAVTDEERWARGGCQLVRGQPDQGRIPQARAVRHERRDRGFMRLGVEHVLRQANINRSHRRGAGDLERSAKHTQQ